VPLHLKECEPAANPVGEPIHGHYNRLNRRRPKSYIRAAWRLKTGGQDPIPIKRSFSFKLGDSCAEPTARLLRVTYAAAGGLEGPS
jgi:hypothetical protein